MVLAERSSAASQLWDARLAAVLTDPSLLRLLFQPIVDLQRGVSAGYETLARFDEPDGRPSPDTPDRWLAAADASGCGARLEAVVVRQAPRPAADPAPGLLSDRQRQPPPA